jgi:RimJ/RimL family protein N-acetyltransferase
VTATIDIEALYHEPVTLETRHVRLEPLTPGHAEGLFEAYAGDSELWAYLPWPVPYTLEDIRAWLAAALERQEQGLCVPFAVVSKETERAIGSTSYIEPSAANRHIDIGWTWYGRKYWRSAVNTECKYLLLQRAFEVLGCIRVGLRCDLRNERSQRAIERIGGVREGVLRKAQILPDGHERYVVYYSLLDEEWPARKAWFEEQLGR